MAVWLAGWLAGTLSTCLLSRPPTYLASVPPRLLLPVPAPPAVILDYLSSKRISSGDLVVVSPDVGGVARARAFAKKLNDAPLAIVDKRRSAHNVSEVMNLIGDVRGKVAVLVDDMIDTAGGWAGSLMAVGGRG
jgi:phosphoribosylpyrophosphate synthetase